MALTEDELEVILVVMLVLQQVMSLHTNVLIAATNYMLHSKSTNQSRRLLAMVVLLMQSIQAVFHRECQTLSDNYIEPRSREWSGWYMTHVLQENPVRFKYLFRVSPSTFRYICDLLREDLTTNPPQGLRNLTNRQLSVERQVGMCLRRLASGCLLLTLSEIFGVSVPCVSDVMWRFVTSFIYHARRIHLCWPEGIEMERVKEEFWHVQGFPNCCGVLDVTHFQIELPPGENSVNYRDWKNGQSISMQAICDSRLRFLDVFAGWPGSIQDARLLRNSAFFDDVVFRRTKLSGPKFRFPSGFQAGEYIIGDSGYPYYTWLIRPFPGVTERSRKREFNYRLSSTRMCIERAFGQLKNAWRLLSRKIYRTPAHRIPQYVLCACILHNLRIDRGDTYDPAWDVDPEPTYDPGNLHAPQVGDPLRDGQRYLLAFMNNLVPEDQWHEE